MLIREIRGPPVSTSGCGSAALGSLRLVPSSSAALAASVPTELCRTAELAEIEHGVAQASVPAGSGFAGTEAGATVWPGFP